jgi:S1-C subfamily serine protease
LSGNVVGITNAGTSYGFNFAITSNIVKLVVASIIEKSYYSHPFIGFYILELTPEVIKDNNILNVEPFQSGLLVWDVIENYPAEQAGLKGVVETTDPEGQTGYMARDIVLAIDGHPTRTIAEWTAYVEEHVSPRQTVTLTVWRSGETTTVNVTATSRPSYD